MAGKFTSALNTGNPSYFIGKLGDWIRQSGSGATMGDIPVQMLRKSLDAFRTAIAESDPENDVIKHDVLIITYVLDQFDKYMNRQKSDIANNHAAEIYRSFLSHQWRDFETVAQDMEDEEK